MRTISHATTNKRSKEESQFHNPYLTNHYECTSNITSTNNYHMPTVDKFILYIVFFKFHPQEILPYSFPPCEDGRILVAIGWLPLRPHGALLLPGERGPPELKLERGACFT